MGAYSSWAMLALTHHVIVQSCSSKPTTAYAVLGDDVCLRGKVLAKTYLDRMTMLGVKISLPKSIISDRFIEFAKKLVTSSYDYSVIGPKLILACTKDKRLFPLLVSDPINKGLLGNRSFPQVISNKFSYKKKIFEFSLYSLYGPTGLVNAHHKAVSFESVVWLVQRRLPADAIRYVVYNALMSEAIREYRNRLKGAQNPYSKV
jgi:hypothetical protein